MTSIFNQTSSLFNQPAQNTNTGGGLFGSSTANTNQKPSSSNVFGGLNLSTSTPQPQQSGGLFGSSTAQPAQSGGLFGNTNQPQQSGGLFGNTQDSKPGGLFGSTSTAQPQQSSGIFGQPQNQQQNTQQGGGLFGNLGSTAQGQQPQQQQQQQPGGSVFGGFGQSTQPSQLSQQQQSVLGQSLGQSRLFAGSEIAPRQRSVIDQIELAFAKWNPQSPQTLFQTYLYNTVPESDAPFYGPGAGEDESKWEEALAKKPTPGSIPVSVQGFEQLASRMQQQYQNLTLLRGRLHEINDGLNTLLQKHELDVSVRLAACRQKHKALSKQCLSLAAKTQVLRNRGYAMDIAEEELRKKLVQLERQVVDPGLTGRAEEIWARMINVRDRGRILQREFEQAGKDVEGANGGVELDEEVIQRARKILEDYSSQLAHLSKELEIIKKDWKEYEDSRPLTLSRT